MNYSFFHHALRGLLLLALATLPATRCHARQRVLVIAELGGQHVEFTQRGLQWLRDQAREGDFELTEVNDCLTLGPDSVGRFDLIVQLNYPPYMWSTPSMADFERYVDQGGGGWIGFHHASLLGEFDGYDMWPWFSQFMGGIRFQNYIAEKADGQVTVEEPSHPVMQGVPPRFWVAEDEWYTYDRNPRPGVKVLASVDEESYRPASSIRMGDHPVIWTNPEKQARNVYFQIGHSASLFDNPSFVRMFRNAICWGLGRPLPVEPPVAACASAACRPAPADRRLPLQGWIHEGEGTLRVQGDTLLVVAVPVETGRRATGSPDDPDYALYGTCTIALPLGGADLSGVNRLSMSVLTDTDPSVRNLNVALDNATPSGLGAHLVNLPGQGWHHVDYRLDELPREAVSRLRIYTDLKGRNLTTRDTIHYYIKDLRLGADTAAVQVAGWVPDARQGLVYSTGGYLPEGGKTALLGNADGRYDGTERFRLTDALTGQTVMEAPVALQTTSIGSFAVLDFSAHRQPGLYRLQVGNVQSEPFRIAPDALSGSLWRVLSFIHAQRCGAAVEGVHGDCHHDVFALHDGQRIGYGGGWHDAGDLSQQTLQTGDVAYALLEASQALRESDSQLSRALADEARHGLSQLLRCRFGDGWRASSIGLLHWTDGLTGTADDIETVRTQNMAFDNFLSAAYEAYGALVLGDTLLRKAAREDFAFACAKLERDGFDRFPHMMEHTYHAGPALQLAAASWAASMLHRLTGDDAYARQAADWATRLTACQEQKGRVRGFFYRDRHRRSLVHSIHQSREQLIAQALTAVCEQQPAHRDAPRWQQAIRLYGDYLKMLMPATAPYGMAPSGVYLTREYRDRDAFSRLHLWAPADAEARYDRQLEEGIKIDSRHYVRRFPVWFSIFNGNEAIILSTGKAATLCGRFLGDEALVQAGRDQVYWTLGRNPFGQSLIYGEGHGYPSMDSFSSGELTGEMPVGIRTLGDSDVPFWPQTNNACYKEVWTTVAGKWLSLLAELH